MRTASAFATVILFLSILASCRAVSRPMLAQSARPTSTSRVLTERDCRTSDISIEQYEISGVGLPTFQVRILNLCTNPRCTVSSLIMHCGLFHTGDVLVNPKVFRRLDPKQGTCIVNDGGKVRNADAVVFRYREIWKQPITFLSARVVCH